MKGKYTVALLGTFVPLLAFSRAPIRLGPAAVALGQAPVLARRRWIKAAVARLTRHEAEMGPDHPAG